MLSVPDDDFLVAPSWCITDDELLVSLFPQAIKARLGCEANAPSLVDRPEIAALFERDSQPLLIAYQDTKPLFELFYPMLQVFARLACAELQREGVDVDVSILPRLEATFVYYKFISGG